MDDREGFAPVALTAEEPVPELVVDGRLAFVVLLEPLAHPTLGLVRFEPVEEVGIDVDSVAQPGFGLDVLAAGHDFHDGQRELRRECKVPGVVGGDGHDGSRAVGVQHVVRDPDGNLGPGHGMDRPSPRVDAALLMGFGDPSTFAASRSLLDVGVDCAALVGGRDAVDQRVFWGQDHIGRSEQRVGPGGEDFDLLVVAIQIEDDASALGSSDPVALHLLDGFGPVDLVEIVDQPIGVGRDAQHPLAHGYADDGMAAALALAIDHLFVGEDRSQGRAPVDRNFGEIGQVAFVELFEDPLGPLEIARIGRVDFAGPVVVEAERRELMLEVLDVALRLDARMRTGLDGVLLGGQAEGVPSHRMQHIEAAHALVAREHVRRDVALGVSDVEAGARGVGEHVQHVELGLGRIEHGLEDLMLVPIGLPARFDGLGFVRHGQTVPGRSHDVNRSPQIGPGFITHRRNPQDCAT